MRKILWGRSVARGIVTGWHLASVPWLQGPHSCSEVMAIPDTLHSPRAGQSKVTVLV